MHALDLGKGRSNFTYHAIDNKWFYKGNSKKTQKAIALLSLLKLRYPQGSYFDRSPVQIVGQTEEGEGNKNAPERNACTVRSALEHIFFPGTYQCRFASCQHFQCMNCNAIDFFLAYFFPCLHNNAYHKLQYY